MTAVFLLAAYGIALLFGGREIARATPRSGALMAVAACMIVLAILAGGAFAGVDIDG